MVGLLVLALGFQGSRGLWEPDEGRYTNVALEMLRSGDYLLPMLHHERPHFTKPPLTYWAIAASLAVFGHSEWAVRLPNALAFVLTTLLLFRMGRIFLPARPEVPAFVYATMALPYLAANAVTTDTLLTLWETLAVTAFATAVFGGSNVGRRCWLRIMWLGFGLAFLTKGPPGMLPLLAILLYQWRYRPLPMAELFAPVGLALFVIAAFSWYAAVVVKRPDLLAYFVGYEVIDRVASDVHHRNSSWYGGFTVYLPTLLIGGLPWVVFLLAKLRVAHLKAPVATFRALSVGTQFLFIWLTIPLLIFFLARSRLPLYILPLAAPLATLSALALPVGWLSGRRGWWFIGCTALLLLGARGLAVVYPSDKDSRGMAQEIREQVSESFNEVVFVDERPRYGLSFYLDVEIESVCLRNNCGNSERFPWLNDENMATELLESQEGRLFLIDGDSFDAFAELARRRGGMVATRLGKVRGILLVVLK